MILPVPASKLECVCVCVEHLSIISAVSIGAEIKLLHNHGVFNNYTYPVALLIMLPYLNFASVCGTPYWDWVVGVSSELS
jgi:hypothetical protein